MSKNTKGYVYILSNESFPGLLKIGASKIGGHRRSEELYSAGVPTPFKLEFEIFCDNAFRAEAIAHDDLDDYRENRQREFFRIDKSLAVKRITSVVISDSLDESINYVSDWDFIDKRELRERFNTEGILNVAGQIVDTLGYEFPAIDQAINSFIHSAKEDDIIKIIQSELLFRKSWPRK